MELPPESLDLENCSSAPQEKPTFARTCKSLLDRWDRGERGRELALHLLFCSWYLLLEPSHLTGLSPEDPIGLRLEAVFNEVHDHYEPMIESDAEMLYVVGLMANLTPWLLGDMGRWEGRSLLYRKLYRGLAPNGLDPLRFANRGAYGDYFAGQAGVVDGY